MKLIIQIVPRLPPLTDGVGDYSLNLARQLRQDYKIHTHFIVCDRNWQGENTIDDFPVSKLSETTSNALVSLLSRQQINTVLLHYVGYGYAKRGCPTWLINGLENWRSSNNASNLVTMFHEVFAAGRPPWTSAFWLFWWQKQLASDLARLSNRVITSKRLYADILSNLSQGKHSDILALPVFSSIGEPKRVPSLSDRQPWLVVFGGKSNRYRAYSQFNTKINHTCQILGIKKIIDIGQPTGLSLSSICDFPVDEIGMLPSNKISELLLDCRVGFSAYNPEYLGKSTIFAAYCSHGLLPVNAEFSDCLIDGIELGRHYWTVPKDNSHIHNLDRVQEISDNAYAWYQTHKLEVQTKVFFNHLMTHTKQNLVY